MSNETMAKKSQSIRLTKSKIIDWANAHYVRKGNWPTYRSGRVFEAPELDWSSIDGCLEFGGFGVPGGLSLAHLLAKHRGLESGRKAPPLSIELILVWADRHHIRTGSWPTEDAGPVMGVPGELWKNIDGALRRGMRGLPGGSSVPQLLAEHRGKRRRMQGPPLTVEQILSWADDYKKRNDVWPTQRSGPITGVPGHSWDNIQCSLRRGQRGLPGGSSLIQLLVEQRGRRPRIISPELTIEQVLGWAKDHRKRTGKWPNNTDSGKVLAAPHESWSAIDGALKHRCRGLSDPRSLARLLAEQLGAVIHGYKQPLTVQRILKWADEHCERTGSWPQNTSGPVQGVEGETWNGISLALSNGGRGLRRGGSLAKLLVDQRGALVTYYKPRLTLNHILEWADAHRERTGSWPSLWSGKVHRIDNEAWGNIDGALTHGLRGLRGGESLARLIRRKRGDPSRVPFPQFTVKQVLTLADRHKKRTGRWPGGHSGMIHGARHETWQRVDQAIAWGTIPGGDADTLHKLLVKHRGVKRRAKPEKLTIAQVLKWADKYHKRMGRWPSGASGRIVGTKQDTWLSVDSALRYGNRGLPGGSALGRLLEKKRGKPVQTIGGPLAIEKILEWADHHYAKTGSWPNESSGRVLKSRHDSWKSVGEALRNGRRGMPGGTTLAKLLYQHGRKPS